MYENIHPLQVLAPAMVYGFKSRPSHESSSLGPLELPLVMRGGWETPDLRIAKANVCEVMILREAEIGPAETAFCTYLAYVPGGWS